MRPTSVIQSKGAVLSIGVKRLLVGNRVGVGLTPSIIRLLLPPLFPVKGASIKHPYGSIKPPVVRTGQHPGAAANCSNTN